MLRYYDAAGAHFKGAILLDGCEVNALPAATRPQDKFVFEVVSGERRNYVLACATEELRGEWLQKLEEEISRHSEILMALAPEAKTKRLENRHPETNKLQERKGGAVLAGMERALPAGVDPTRAIRCLVDGDSAHPIGSFVGAALSPVPALTFEPETSSAMGFGCP